MRGIPLELCALILRNTGHTALSPLSFPHTYISIHTVSAAPTVGGRHPHLVKRGLGCHPQQDLTALISLCYCGKGDPLDETATVPLMGTL